MESIEELKAKIKALENQIAMLQNAGNIVTDRAKFERRMIGKEPSDDWIVSVSVRRPAFENTEQYHWQKIVHERSREDAILILDYIIDALTELKGLIQNAE